MKKSNNLLLGLLAIVIIGMFVINVILKNQIDQQVTKVLPSKEISDPAKSKSDSIAMEGIILNNE